MIGYRPTPPRVLSVLCAICLVAVFWLASACIGAAPAKAPLQGQAPPASAAAAASALAGRPATEPLAADWLSVTPSTMLAPAAVPPAASPSTASAVAAPLAAASRAAAPLAAAAPSVPPRASALGTVRLPAFMLTMRIPPKSSFSTSTLALPDRYVIDLTGVTLPRGQQGLLPVAWPAAQRVRVAQYDANTVRVVVDLNVPVSFRVVREPQASGPDLLSVVPGPSLDSVVLSADDGSLVPPTGAGSIAILRGPLFSDDAVVEVDQTVYVHLQNHWFSSPSADPMVCVHGRDLDVSWRVGYAAAWTTQPLPDQAGTIVRLYPRLTSLSVANATGGSSLTIRSLGPLSPSQVSVEASEPGDAEQGVLVTLHGHDPAGLGPIAAPEPGGMITAVSLEPAAVGETRLTLALCSPVAVSVAQGPDPESVVVSLALPGLSGLAIVIDPGHGGSEPGAQGRSGLQEKDPVLDVAMQVADILRMQGATVILTRTDDTAVSLRDRTLVGQELKPPAAAFVSIHANSFTAATAGGTETWYARTSPAESQALAQSIQNAEVQALGLVDRGIKINDTLAVIRNRTVPSVLHELCFISNPAEEALLLDPAAKHKMAEAIARGITDFLKADPR